MDEKTSHSKSLVLISDTTFYPIYFKQKLADDYTVTPLAASGFEITDLKYIFSDLVVIDEKPFGENLFRLITEIRRTNHYQDKPILVITGKLKKAHIDRLIKAGVNDFLREPLEDKEILDKLKNVGKYHEMSAKLHSLAGKMTPMSKEKTRSLKNRFLLNRYALDPIKKKLQEGGYISVLALCIDQENLLTEAIYEEMCHFVRAALASEDLLFALNLSHFLIILDETSAKKGLMIAERLKNDVLSRSFGDEQFTLSIGLCAQKRPPHTSINEMINDAKNAALKAKESGNCIKMG